MTQNASQEEAPRDEYRALVSLGGDGTLNEVINGILTSEKLIPFSVIPTEVQAMVCKRQPHIPTLVGSGRSS